jgi:hypothetical protein
VIFKCKLLRKRISLIFPRRRPKKHLIGESDLEAISCKQETNYAVTEIHNYIMSRLDASFDNRVTTLGARHLFTTFGGRNSTNMFTNSQKNFIFILIFLKQLVIAA